jgi:hypothetical protein
MIYLHVAAPETIPLAMRSRTDDLTMAVTYFPGAKRYDGIIYIIIPRASVIAHGIGHLLGFDHSARGLMEAHAPDDWFVSVDQISLAHANRLRALLEPPLVAFRDGKKE